MGMSFKLIEQALALGETGNFARAAERLGITQPTLTRNIAALEAELGVRLFDRGRRGGVSTAFGRAVIGRGALLLRDAQALQGELRALAKLEVGVLEVVAGPYAAADLVGPAVAKLVCEHPRLRVRVSVVLPDQIGPELLSGRGELGVGGVESQGPHEELQVLPMRLRRLYLACRPGHPLAGRRPTRPQVLEFPLVAVVLHGDQAKGYSANTRAAVPDRQRKGVTPAIEVTSLDMAKRIAAGSDALFPGSMQMLVEELAAGRLVTLDYDTPELRARSGLVQRRHRSLSPAAERFVQLLHEVEDEQFGNEIDPARPKLARAR